MSLTDSVISHYGKGDLLQRIEQALRQAGRDPDHPGVDELAGVDEFHARGREATRELADLLPASLDTELLDVGSGIGGPARFLAATRGYRVAGIDLTPEYVAVANELAHRCGLAGKVRFLAADALAMPFEDASFAAAYTQHAAMNIADKAGLYREIARVLRPGATFVIYDILQGPGGAARFPAPWSSDGTTSFLVDRSELERHLAESGFAVEEHRERREESLAWFETRIAAAAAAGGPPPVGIRLLLGPVFAEAFANLVVDLREERVVPTFLRAVRR
ncbi:MAG: class I SAM-dependent methyltransferase [Geminicoccaceae bacterium]